MYQVEDTLAGYESVATAATKRAGLAALRRLRTAHPTRDYRLVIERAGLCEVLA